MSKTLPDLPDPDEEARAHRRRRPTVEVQRLPVLSHSATPTLTRWGRAGGAGRVHRLGYQHKPQRTRIPKPTSKPASASTHPAGCGATPTPEEDLWTRKGWAGRTS